MILKESLNFGQRLANLYVTRRFLRIRADHHRRAGTQQITNHLATLLRKALSEHVAWKIRDIFRFEASSATVGFALTPVDVADDGLIIEKLPTIRTAAHASNRPTTPTGAACPLAAATS